MGVNISTTAAMVFAANARECTGPEFPQCLVTEDILSIASHLNLKKGLVFKIMHVSMLLWQHVGTNTIRIKYPKKLCANKNEYK